MSIEYCECCEQYYCDECDPDFECVICEKTFCSSCADTYLNEEYKCKDCIIWNNPTTSHNTKKEREE